MRQYLTATRYTLLELARNRLALGLLVIFVPIWFLLLGSVVPDTPVPFRFRSTGAFIQANGHDIMLLTAGLNALTLIVGFLMFAATRKAAPFDRRLVLCGFTQRALILAKLTALIVASALIALYTMAVLLAFWRPQSLALVWAGYAFSALVYGGLGILIGVLVSSETAGFFLVIMISLIDTGLQTPVENPVANAGWLAALPAYGPTQLLVAGGFTSFVPWREALLALAWFAGFALVGLLIFWMRTRAWNAHSRLNHPAQPAPSLA
ncbi:MAG TPA: hypothetical protein VF120_12225 [Ktedonobacterales bacterium]